MGRFFRGGAVFPMGRFGRGEPFAPPVGQDAIVPLSNAFPVGGTVPVMLPRSQPMIQPELIGAVPQKPILPALFDAMTRASFLDRGSFSVPVPMDPMVPRGASPLLPPPPITSIFTTKTSVAIQDAINRDNRALIAAKISLGAQRKADAAAHAADKAITKASFDPTSQARGDAEAKSKDAENADEIAKRAAIAAAERQAEADAAAAKAREVEQQMLDGGWGVGGGPVLYAEPTEGLIVAPPGKVPVVAIGGGAAVGFAVGGPVGAFIGALLGGVGYNYVKNR